MQILDVFQQMKYQWYWLPGTFAPLLLYEVIPARLQATPCLHAPDQAAEAAEGGGEAGAGLADKRTVNRVVDRGIAAGQLLMAAMRLPGRRPRDKVL